MQQEPYPCYIEDRSSLIYNFLFIFVVKKLFLPILVYWIIMFQLKSKKSVTPWVNDLVILLIYEKDKVSKWVSQ